MTSVFVWSHAFCASVACSSFLYPSVMMTYSKRLTFGFLHSTVCLLTSNIPPPKKKKKIFCFYFSEKKNCQDITWIFTDPPDVVSKVYNSDISVAYIDAKWGTGNRWGRWDRLGCHPCYPHPSMFQVGHTGSVCPYSHWGISEGTGKCHLPVEERKYLSFVI